MIVTFGIILIALITVFILAFFRFSTSVWIFALLMIVSAAAYHIGFTHLVSILMYAALAAYILLFGIPFVRRALISRLILSLFRKTLPQISATEQEAIDAGTVWWDGELFSGKPNWNKLLSLPKNSLRSDEQDFLCNETEQLCSMLDDWDITHNRADLPPEVWQFMKDKGFFGMIIPKKYGGLEFSAQAHSAVICKLSSRSSSAAVTVMVPNSLGPAELILHYGTDEQKDKYLYRLAKGLDVPCFALTGSVAGSDAGSIPDYGIVCYGEFAGKQNVLGVRLTWEKRYITLSPVATLLGLAFKLHDPDHLLSGETNRGITLALIPTEIPGVSIGRRHLPLDSAFMNGLTQGNKVFIPIDYIIGGPSHVGQGWRMLMECLASGRSISLPASSVGGMKLAARTSGAYSRVRKQFKLPIGKFEGVEEPLARIGAHTYMTDAARRLTVLALDLGEKPSVISAIMKYHATERGRIVVNDAMDVLAGKGICLGPDNYIGRFYQQTPIGITAEGANILTRTLMIFGQGAIRSHPFVLKEISAAHDINSKKGLRLFDEVFFDHISFAVSNALRSFVFGISNGYGAGAPAAHAHKRYYRQLTRFSSAFAISADLAMSVLGGLMKRKEKISARMGDVLSLLYLCSATLKRFEDDGRPQEDLPLLHWSMQDALYKIQQAFDGLIQNFPTFWGRWLLSWLIFPMGQRLSPPSDALGHKVAALLLKPGASRDRLTDGIYVQDSEDDAVGALDAALISTFECEALQAKLKEACRTGNILAADDLLRIEEARSKNIITAEEALKLERDFTLRRKVIMVDDFSPEQLKAR